MRIHVVTPKAPVYVVVNPHIQPQLTTPLFFHCGHEVKLTPAKYWTMRLPFVYYGPNGVILSPREGNSPIGRSEFFITYSGCLAAMTMQVFGKSSEKERLFSNEEPLLFDYNDFLQAFGVIEFLTLN
ncbi:unnamed protein product [Soboliphyme baturini]|uniref:Nonsense-mediated mRNA decay factor SMG8 n=1 Tax=Soboliphyme baturini TaxID=241478 RepID=A0A183J5P3_9BILA|nr:unnamed protein product [Soboliphyme baturini]